MACYSPQQAVWQDSGINSLKMNSIIESYYPAASASLPPPREAAGTHVGCNAWATVQLDNEVEN